MDSNKTDIPLVEPVELEPITLDKLPAALQAAVGRAGWPALMPVQSKAIPYLLENRDIMVQSRTGSGKTGGFLLPSIERIDPNMASCQSLILTPTRELANQIAAEANTLFAGTGVNVVPVYGGVPYRRQQAAFRKGAHLVVGTPGRILDHLGRSNLKLDDIKMLTLDEADRMLSVGFYQDMKAVQRYLPQRRVNTCMFSATFPPYVLRLAEDFLVDPITLSLSSDTVHVTDIQHVRYDVSNHLGKDRLLVNIIETENPDNAIIFCNSRQRVKYVAAVLERYGYDVDRLSGELQQKAREKVLKRIREGNLRLLVATDVAARGIDIPSLSHVIQYEVPEDIEAYVHRAGRTGRAGASGTAIILVEMMDTIRMGKVMRTYEVDMQTHPLPVEEDVTAAINQRVEVALGQSYRERSETFTKTILQYELMVEQMMMDGTGIRAIAMLVDDFYQQRLKEGAKDRKEVLPPELTGESLQKIVLSLADDLKNRDTLRLERIMRFEPLVEQLSMTADEFYLLTMLIADYHVVMQTPKKSKPKPKTKRKSSSSSGRRKSKSRKS